MKWMNASSFLMKNRPLYYLFGSTSNAHHQKEDVPIITKHNPTGQKDLRGH